MFKIFSVTLFAVACVQMAVSVALQNVEAPFSKRIAPEKVPEELAHLLNLIKPINSTISQVGSPVIESESCDCGIKGTNRIVAGTLTGVSEWTWQAFLYIDNTYMCGGALLNYNWVLTAGHCIFGMKDVGVFLGFNNIKNAASAKHITTASSLIVHESYDDTTSRNDIALLKLATPVPAYTTFIKPVCLPYKYNTTDFQRTKATVTGWGRTSEGGSLSMRLREVQMTVLNRTQCTSSPYRMPPAYITDSMFCMYKLGADSCQGDSGGPVNWQETNAGRVYQIGIVSFGKGCARRNWPGVYTRVTEFLDWIDGTAGI